MRRGLAFFVLALDALALALGACGSDKPFATQEAPDAASDAGSVAPDVGAGVDAGGSITGDGASVGTGCCSSDLHSVIDCNTGQSVQRCPDNEGCAAGQCVYACDAAQANKSTVGCDYYSVDPDIILEGQGACFAAYIANTWTMPVTLTVERAGQSIDPTGFARIPTGSGKGITYAPLPNGQILPGQVAILFLAQSQNPANSPGAVYCPTGITPAYTQVDGATLGTGIGEAFHIQTSVPVVAYDIFPYGGGDAAMTSATLLLPTSAWDTNYIAVNAFPKSIIAASANARPSLDIVASEDNTTVTFNPTAAIEGGGAVPPGVAGVPTTYTLNKGQVLQFTQDAELTGSPIQSDKPIAVWGAASCLNIDPNTCCCDSAHQEIPPVKALGHEYAAVRYRNRDDTLVDETPPWRFVGAVDGTVLSYDPAPPTGAPTTLNSGQVAQFNSVGQFVVRSQDDKHPFYVSGHMSGCTTYFDPTDCRGDAEFVNLVPPQQYLPQYTFFTDPTYPETNLVVVRPKAQDGSFKDVVLDCAGTLTGWQPLDKAGTYQFTRFDISRHNFVGQGQCNNGVHDMHSDAPFGLTVWGWGSKETGGIYGDPQAPGFYTLAVSYAYPAGMSIAPINTVVVPAR
jgi:IgGFc binding protein